MRWNLYKTPVILLVTLALSALLSPVTAQITTEDKDQLYVTDKLRLSMYERPDDRSRVVKLLVSGDLLTVEELSGNYALVTSQDNVRGWAKRGFLVEEPTSNLQLAIELEKNEALQEEVNRLGNAKQVLDQYEKDMDALNETAISMEQSNNNLQTRLAELEQTVSDKQAEIDELKSNDGIDPGMVVDIAQQYWQLLLGALVILTFIIFMISKMIVEARIRNHFQGIKVW